MKKTFVIVASFILCLCLISCTKEVIGSFKDFSNISKKLAQKYSAQQCGFRSRIYNGEHFVAFGMVNSPYNDAEEDEKKLVAREAAQFVKSQYGEPEKLKTITISFQRMKSFFFGFFKSFRGKGTFTFKQEDLL